MTLWRFVYMLCSEQEIQHQAPGLFVPNLFKNRFVFKLGKTVAEKFWNETPESWIDVTKLTKREKSKFPEIKNHNHVYYFLTTVRKLSCEITFHEDKLLMKTTTCKSCNVYGRELFELVLNTNRGVGLCFRTCCLLTEPSQSASF